MNIYKKVGFLLASATLVATLCTAQETVQPNAQGICCKAQGMDIHVGFYSPGIVRVYKVPEGETYHKESLVVTKQAEKDVPVKVEYEGKSIILTSAQLRVTVDSEKGGIRFCTADGSRELLFDKDYGTTFFPVDDGGTASYRVNNSFLLAPDEPIYGIGQVMDGHFNRRHSMHHLQNENMFTYSPYFFSPTRGYALYWDNYSISDFVDTPQGLSFQSLGHCADYYFLYGGTPDGVISQVRELTGHAPMLPLWAYGFFQSKERYQTQQESLEVLKRFRKLRIPIDCIIQDWRYWPEYQHTDSAWNSHLFDPERFPDPRRWADEIHRLNAKLLIVAWPGFGSKTDQYRELDAKNMILHFDTYPSDCGVSPYDVYHPEARDIYWKYLNQRLFSYIGNDGWWLDSTEPDHNNRRESDYLLPTYLGTYRSVKNAFSLMHNSGIATHQRALDQEKRVVILTRSGFVGQQRFGSNTWSGDVQSTWEMLEKQIPAALNYTLMGIPNWNSDIGGFFAGHWNEGGGARNPGFQELYVRWMQFATFCPMMRSHGTNVPREIWNFGNRGEWCFDAQERMIKLRYRLLPYIYSTSWLVSRYDGTFMRPLLMDFVEDEQTYQVGNEYLFGQSLLVAPVTRPAVASWPVYLPKGTDWWDFWSNECLHGGQSLERPVDKDMLPLYVRAGSILPFGPDVQYSTEKDWDNLELRIYPGADATFTLYEDENDNYNYEKGICSVIRFHWDEARRMLTIDDREGRFPGMLERRTFRVVLVDGKSGAGDHPMKNGKQVRYAGTKVCVRF